MYQRIPELIRFAQNGISVIGVGYRGYGKSSGHPSEKGVYLDAEAAIRFGMDSLHFTPDNIFICGRSIGSTAAVHAGAIRDYAGIILITPLTTAKEYAGAHGLGLLSPLAGNAFNNYGTCTGISSPVLIIHGTDDEVIPFWMGKKLFDIIKSPKKFIVIEGGFHNTLEYRNPELYWGTINEFMQEHGNKHAEPGRK